MPYYMQERHHAEAVPMHTNVEREALMPQGMSIALLRAQCWRDVRQRWGVRRIKVCCTLL